MKSIQSTSYNVVFNDEAYESLNDLILNGDYSKIFLFMDENTHRACASIFLSKLRTELLIEIIEVPAGESFKNLETVYQVWESLTELGADRKALIINLGGGVVTDMGGFIASTFKRGVDFVNIPTTLLAMVDASVGGKTGIDLGVLKNQIGVFSNPELVIVDSTYLESLNERDSRSGLAEIMKYGLTYDTKLWKAFLNPSQIEVESLIHRSIEIKNEVVLKDPKENNLRKILNFGHTLGHAIESFYLDTPELEAFTHGEAIAIGMICESYISYKQVGLSNKELNEIQETIIRVFGHYEISRDNYEGIFEYLKHDKKNIAGRVKFVLIPEIGLYKINEEVDSELLTEAIDFYNSKALA
jgi:3-dehydroquinate synthase